MSQLSLLRLFRIYRLRHFSPLFFPLPFHLRQCSLAMFDSFSYCLFPRCYIFFLFLLFSSLSLCSFSASSFPPWSRTCFRIKARVRVMLISIRVRVRFRIRIKVRVRIRLGLGLGLRTADRETSSQPSLSPDNLSVSPSFLSVCLNTHLYPVLTGSRAARSRWS